MCAVAPISGYHSAPKDEDRSEAGFAERYIAKRLSHYSSTGIG